MAGMMKKIFDMINPSEEYEEEDKKTKTIAINQNEASDFPIQVTGLERGDYTFKFNIVSGKFDLEYLLYEI